jgi:hypothetical protein
VALVAREAVSIICHGGGGGGSGDGNGIVVISQVT